MRIGMEGVPPQVSRRSHCCKRKKSLSRYNSVDKFVPLPQALKIPNANAAVEKENKGRKVHFASLMDLSQESGVGASRSKVQRQSRTPR